jgi:hypothetical protein
MVAARAAGPLQIDEGELLQGLLAFEVNSHVYDGGAALFNLASKLAHTCGRPNTLWVPVSSRCIERGFLSLQDALSEGSCLIKMH